MANIDPYLEAIENAVYGEEVRGSIHDAIAAINDEYESAEEIIEQVIPNMIAEEFSAESTYAVGDFVVHGNTLYICNTAIVTAGEWDSSKWTATLITDNLGSGASGVHIFEFDEPASAGSVTQYDPEINYANIARYLDAGEEVILKGGFHFYFVDEYTSGDVYHNIVFKRFSTVGKRISSSVSLNRDLAAPIYSTFKVFTPSVSASDEGKILVVNSSGEWEKQTPSSVGQMELTQAEYDQLSQAEKMNGTTYYITDGGAPSGTVFNMTAGANINIESAYYIEYADYYAVRIKITATGSISASSDLLTDTPQLLSAHNVVCSVIGNNIYDMDSAVFGQANRVFKLRNKSLVGGDSVEFSGILFK